VLAETRGLIWMSKKENYHQKNFAKNIFLNLLSPKNVKTNLGQQKK
jgi:hypothetical protein